MESTKDAQVMTTKEEMEEQKWENLISSFKKIKVSTSFVENLEKEPWYLDFYKEVDLKRQELQKSKPTEKKSKLTLFK